MNEIKEIVKKIKTQDNKIISDPIFYVYDCTKGLTLNNDHEGYVYILNEKDVEFVQFDTRAEAVAFCEENDISEDKIEKYPFKYSRWVITACFTNEYALKYIEKNIHNLSNPFIHVGTLKDNKEMKMIRDFLIEKGE